MHVYTHIYTHIYTHVHAQVAIMSANFFTILNRFLSGLKYSIPAGSQSAEEENGQLWYKPKDGGSGAGSNYTRLEIKGLLFTLTLSLLESAQDTVLLVEMCETLDFELLISELEHIFQSFASAPDLEQVPKDGDTCMCA